MNLLTRWHDLDATERVARLRSLSMGARLLCGRQADRLNAALHRAETDTAALVDCDAEMGKLPTLRMRQLLSTFIGTLRVPVSHSRDGGHQEPCLAHWQHPRAR